MSDRAALSDLLGICRTLYVGARARGQDRAADEFAAAGELLKRARQAHDRRATHLAHTLADDAIRTLSAQLDAGFSAQRLLDFARGRLEAPRLGEKDGVGEVTATEVGPHPPQAVVRRGQS
jgi:hypothetical protein